MLNSSIHRNKSIIWGQSLTQTIQSIIWRLRHWAELGHHQPGHSHHKRERESQTWLVLLRFDLNRQIWNKFANLWRISDAISKNDLFDSQSFWLKNKSFWFQKSPPWCTHGKCYHFLPIACDVPFFSSRFNLECLFVILFRRRYGITWWGVGFVTLGGLDQLSPTGYLWKFHPLNLSSNPSMIYILPNPAF
jgi:hypothetical protein